MDSFINFFNYIKKPSYSRGGVIEILSISVILLTNNSLMIWFIMLFIVSGFETLYCYSKKKNCNNINFINVIYIIVNLLIILNIILSHNVYFKLRMTNNIFDYILITLLNIAATIGLILDYKKRDKL